MSEECNCDSVNKKPSFFNSTFWDQWLQKIFRNFASMKFQWLTILYIPVVWGMFDGKWITLADGTMKWVSKIGVTEGLAFLGGGFITLATGRIIARTKLTEPSNENFDTDK